MRLAVPAALVVLGSVLMAAAPASAQEPVWSFDQLNTRLKPGDTVRVIDPGGVETTGRVLELHPSSLVIDTGGPRAYAAGDVRAVLERRGKPLGKAALWGTVAGAGVGVALALAYPVEDPPAPSCPPAPGPPCGGGQPATTHVSWSIVPLTAALGAGVGTMMGALLPARWREVYRAPRTPGSPQARLSISPVVTPRAKGVAVSFAF